MTVAPRIDAAGALARLEAARDARALPPRAADRCGRIIEALRRPVRVTILGVPGAGKRRLLDAFAGHAIAAGDTVLPTCQLAFGEAARTTATLADGATLTRDGLPDAALLGKGAVFLRIEAPLPALRRMSFLLVAAEGTAHDMRAALRWCAPRTDLALWCTRRFGDEERAFWSDGPEALKHHALLVQTDPDAPAVEGCAEAGFDGRYRVAPAADGTAGMLAGMEALFARLARDIDHALAEDLDAAMLFLNRFEPRPAAETADADDDSAPAPNRPADAGSPPADPGAAVAEPRRPADVTRLSRPFLYLRARARALLDRLADAEAQGGWAGDVLAHCTETTERLADLLEADAPDDVSGAALHRAVIEASELAVLLQLEGGEEQAREAATLLLQLREEFAQELAA
ncbi:hypothetical protein [Rhodosalinus sp. 5P4]|uniref:hypothetical protein n=1 Tax=Rhodosalinus sp. 5P4 TaxID=3239196 RepID=UPI00352553F8